MEHKSVEEFSVKTLEFGGLGAALQALRLPFGKECRSVVRHLYRTENARLCKDGDVANGVFPTYVTEIVPCDADFNLLSMLAKRGDEHAKVLRGIMVWCEINAPLYWWKEMDTYKVGAERLSSESSMHIEGRGLNEEELLTLQEEMPSGHMQKRVWMFSYQALRRIYFQRRNHRLPQWRRFCEWIEALPFAKEFITIEK